LTPLPSLLAPEAFSFASQERWYRVSGARPAPDGAGHRTLTFSDKLKKDTPPKSSIIQIIELFLAGQGGRKK